jgi:hypothetical protein
MSRTVAFCMNGDTVGPDLAARQGGGRVDGSHGAAVGEWVARGDTTERRAMTNVMDESATQALREVEHLLEGVETPRRMQNECDKKLGIVRHQFDVPVVPIKRGRK